MVDKCTEKCRTFFPEQLGKDLCARALPKYLCARALPKLEKHTLRKVHKNRIPVCLHIFRIQLSHFGAIQPAKAVGEIRVAVYSIVPWFQPQGASFSIVL